MKLNINKYLDIFYSVMNDNNIYSTSILDMVEIVKIIFSSEDFKLLSSRLDVNEFTEDNVLNHRYTIDFDENGVVSFEVPEEKRTKIINDNMVDAGYIQMAINKRALVKQIKKIMNKSTESFDEVVKESPKVYRFKKH